MKIPSLSKQLSSDSKKKKNIQKSKFMKYKPRKGDETKDWQIQGIVNERIVLKLKDCDQKIDKQSLSSIHHSNDKISIIPYQMFKQYEIAWKQDCQKGTWPNTWQPQQNIPEQTRLDYLIKKKNAILNKKKDTNNSVFRKNKQSLKKHIEFTMSKSYPKTQITDKRQKRKQGQRKIAQIQKKKSPPKIKNQQNYKDWYISYSSKTEGFEKLIKRFLKGQKNENVSKQFSSSKKSKNAVKTKKEFFDNIRSMKEEQDAQLIDIIPKSNKNNMQDESIDDGISRSTYAPQPICLKLITDIAYFCQKDDVRYFRLKTQDGVSGYISEDDLAKYLPFSYEQLLTKTIGQKINQCITTLQKINVDGDNNLKYLQKLGNQIGIQKKYFQYINSQRQNDNNSYFKNKQNQSKVSICNDLPNALRKNLSFNDETQKIFSAPVVNASFPSQKQNNKKQQSINEVVNYFDILNKNSDINLPFQIQLNQAPQSQKQNDEVRLLISEFKNLFNQNQTVEADINKNDFKRSNIHKEDKNDKKQTKGQKAFATKKLITPKKIQPQAKLQTLKSSPQKKKTNSPIFKKVFNSTASDNLKKPKNISSNAPQKIKTQQEQLNQILGSISESQNQQEMFYGSEDEQNQK